MEQQFGKTPYFKSAAEEIHFLREQVRQKEAELENTGAQSSREQITSEAVQSYKEAPTKDAISWEHQMQVDEIETATLHLTPEHDKAVDELVIIFQEKGLKNALTIAEKLDNPHIADDFHRFLVQYIAEGMDLPGMKDDTEIARVLRMQLYEVALPEETKDGQERSFAQLVSSMEQFYAGMLSLQEDVDKKSVTHFTLELARPRHSSQLVLYVAVPSTRTDLFEKHILGAFPNARISQHKQDYNPFNEEGVSVGAYASSGSLPVFPLKTFTEFENDPLNIILNTFSRMSHETEAASIQFLVAPKGQKFNSAYKGVLKKVQDGGKAKDAFRNVVLSIGGEFASTAKGFFFSEKKKEPLDEKGLEKNKEDIDAITEKISTPIVDVNIRVVASASTEARASEVLSDITSSFNQFAKPQGNSLVFKHVPEKKRIQFLHKFSYRMFNPEESIPLNTTELTTLFHFPVTKIHAADLKQNTSVSAAPPINISKEGVILGTNSHRGEDTTIHMSREDRMRHFYVIGQTGTGKTTLLKNMIAQDIANGDGVCMIDPHGTDIADILKVIPPHRKDDVIYFDPAYTARPMGLNMLEYDERYPEQKTFVVNEMMSIFNKLFDMKTSGGPMFEQYFRNAVLLVLEDPATGTTLLEVSRVLSDSGFRELKLIRCKNPIVVQFWREVAGKAGGEAALANIVPYITSKFDIFLSNDIMRPIVGQEKSAFNFRKVMDEKKILLVNLSKGRLGDINAHLIGLILVGKILMAALSRVDTPAPALNDFYLYIDEFQNVTTDSIATILSEARKYRLSLNIAHQFIAQLEPGIKDAVFGNVGSMGVFRVGAEDSEFLASQFDPVFSAHDIMNIENRNAYLKLLVDGSPARPFNIATMAPPEGDEAFAQEVKELSYQRYGRDREEVEAEVMKKYGG